MQSVDCPFCDHANPSGAKFCNECGSPLHFAPCKHCDAVNHVNDTQCYRCGAPLTSPPASTEAANFEPGTDAADAKSADFEQQINRLEHELDQIGEEPGPIGEESGPIEEEPGPIVYEPEELEARDEARDPAGRSPRPIEHQLGLLDAAPSARGREPPGPANQAPGPSALDFRARDMLSGANGKKRLNSRAAARRSIPQARLLFSEVAEAPRTGWRGYVAGASGVLLVLAIAAGGYHYYRDELSPDMAVVERGQRVPETPSAEPRAGEMGASSVVSMPPLVKDISVSTPVEPPETVPPVKATVARNEDAAPKAVPAPQDPSPSVEADSTTTLAEKDVAEVAASDPASAAAPAPRCPPAVAAIALCDWIAHADRK